MIHSGLAFQYIFSKLSQPRTDEVYASLLGLPYQNAIVWMVQTADSYFLKVLEFESSRSRCQYGWFLMSLLLLACRKPFSLWSFLCTGVQRERERSLVSLPCLIRTLVLQSPTFMTSVYLNYLPEGAVCKNNHTGDKDINILMGDGVTVWSITGSFAVKTC